MTNMLTQPRAVRYGLYVDGGVLHALRHLLRKTRGCDLDVVNFEEDVAKSAMRDRGDCPQSSVLARKVYVDGIPDDDCKKREQEAFDAERRRRNYRVERHPLVDGKQVGIDQRLMDLSYASASRNEIDVAVLVTADGDFVPHVKALRAHDIDVGVTKFSLSTPDAKACPPIYTNAQFHDVASFLVDPRASIDKNLKEEKKLRSFDGAFPPGPTARAPDPRWENTDVWQYGVVECKNEKGFGFIRGDEHLPGERGVYFVRGDVQGGRWPSLVVGRRVKFRAVASHLGLAALAVYLA
jgi:cold shock CspA family protein